VCDVVYRGGASIESRHGVSAGSAQAGGLPLTPVSSSKRGLKVRDISATSLEAARFKELCASVKQHFREVLVVVFGKGSPHVCAGVL